MLEAHFPASQGRFVLHWFTGTNAEAERAASMGAYFSINAAMLQNPRHRKTIALLPISRVLTETDGPFTKVLGRPDCPKDVHRTVEELAKVRGVDSVELSEIILLNLLRLLSP